ncbi:MAG: family 10 glycosylhydrolase [Clostridioides sp.]|jgi:uncharacterized lipoprotein YddW (UPF0748 family)/putative cell wall-binding protein|nr:family 10 glycosylhydrolase [Clostridioides sp.]
MKKLISMMLSLLMVSTSYISGVRAEQPAKKEMRAAWISTVYNIDWPKTKNNQAKQKTEYTNLLDTLKASGMNAVVVQIRPKSDAIYKSNINPWSEYLTGTQGTDPGYDPLPFLIDEAHKRGMEFHAWFNPYRATNANESLDKLASNNPARVHKDWVVKSGNKYYYNPGMPEVKNYIVDTVKEVVDKYNIDGVHFDDYFYPGTSFADDAAYKQYGNGKNRDDWRRENVNDLLRMTKAAIKSSKPNVRFGVSPAGIWRNKSSDPTGSDTSGNETYVGTYADTRAWIRQGLVDYVTPQLYWPIGLKGADYSKLVPWWANEVKGTNVDLYIGQGVYKQGDTEEANGQNIAKEIKQQIALNRKYPEIKGSMYFSSGDIARNKTLQKDLKEINKEQQIEPEEQLPANVKVEELNGKTRYETAVEISKKGWGSGSKTVVLVNGYSIVDGITSTPLATTEGAPLLLVEKDKIPDSTKAEISRLGAENIVIIGGESSISEKVEEALTGIKKEIKIDRVGGIDRYETSLKIAEKVAEKNEIKEVYITGGSGEADSLSIASMAGVVKQPILLASKTDISEGICEFIKDKSVSNAYFIGGTSVISEAVVAKVNQLVSSDVSKNRISGSNRQETNAKVVEKFYPNTELNSVFASKSDKLVDALTAGPLAAKSNSPVFLVGTALSDSQNTVMGLKKTGTVYRVGGDIPQRAFVRLVNLVSK